MSNTKQKFYLTTPIYYVNARPHIGHAYTTIAADVIARRHRLLGDDTFFLTGTDEHGQKIQRSAEAAGIPPQQFTDEVSASFQNLWKRMGITNDAFIRTTDAHHKRGVQKLFTQLQKNGFIELRSYTGQYCISDETFVDVPVGAACPECGRITETVTEENYFFKLSQFQKPLIDLIESNILAIQPDSRKNEVLSFLRGNISAATNSPQSNSSSPVILSAAKDPRISPEAPTLPTESTPSESVILSAAKDPRISPEAPTLPTESTPSESVILSAAQSAESKDLRFSAKGTPYVPGALKDLSISRTSVKWGIPVPGDEKHVIYVWLDALSNYMTAIGYGSEDPAEQANFKKYWPADLHLVGKEIIRFHCVYWPAFLLALNPDLAGKTPNDLPFEDHLKWAKDWLPKAITAHGWLLFEESKMSKSRGNIVRTETILDAFGTLCPPSTNTASPSQPSTNAVILTPPPTSTVTPPPTSTVTPPPTSTVTPPPTSTVTPPPTNTVTSPPTNTVIPPPTNTVTPPPTNTVTPPPTNTVIPPPTNTVIPPPTNTVISPPTNTVISPPTNTVISPPTNTVILSAAKDPRISFEAPLSSPEKHEQDLFASDVLRYFLLREIPFGQDGSFSFDALVQRYNSDLANGYGNLVSRVLNMINQFCDGKIPESNRGEVRSDFANAWDQIFQQSVEFNTFDFAIYLSHTLLKVAAIDSLLTLWAPWKLAKSESDEAHDFLQDCLYTAAESIRLITAQLYPFLPYATSKVWAQLGLGDIQRASDNGELNNLQWGGLKPGTKLGPLSPIFPRAPKELIQLMNDIEQNNAAQKPAKPAGLPHINNNSDASIHPPTEFRESPISSESATASLNPIAETVHPITAHHPEAEARPDTPQIAIDDFIKIDLRVAQIVVAERIPKADKLLRLEVDLGYERRQILSGIAQWYTPEELIGRKIVVIANLAPRKMRGLESHGMLLAASHGEDGKPVLATFGEDIALGSRLK